MKGTTIPLGATVEYYPISARDQSRLHQFAKKVLPGIFLGYALIAGGIWQGDTWVADVQEVEKIDVIGNPFSKNQCTRSVNATTERIFSYSQLQMVQQNCPR